MIIYTPLGASQERGWPASVSSLQVPSELSGLQIMTAIQMYSLVTGLFLPHGGNQFNPRGTIFGSQKLGRFALRQYENDRKGENGEERLILSVQERHRLKCSMPQW